MRTIRLFLVIFSILFTQQVFANMMSDNKSCGMIADACSSAGYKSDDKSFWMDCMRPVIMGKSVSGVTVDADTVKDCRQYKIKQMKQDMKDMQNAK